jgi:uncharacterized protein YutE (UPF0331/DUF86 family)
VEIMKPLDIESVGKKLTGMIRRIDLLTTYQGMTLDEYLQNEERQAVVERYLEVIIQAAIDINRMLINSVESVDLEKITNAEAFTLVAQLGFITSELADALIPSAGFRNILAHVYDDIIPEAAYKAFHLSLVQYPEYIRQIQTYLNSREENE